MIIPVAGLQHTTQEAPCVFNVKEMRHTEAKEENRGNVTSAGRLPQVVGVIQTAGCAKNYGDPQIHTQNITRPPPHQLRGCIR